MNVTCQKAASLTVRYTKDYTIDIVCYTIFHLIHSAQCTVTIPLELKEKEINLFSIDCQPIIIIKIMGLIAVDKLNRKVLGYICRNGSKNNSISYCCVLCDVEYEAANLLETHMLKHELRSQQDEDEEQQQQQQQQPNEIVPDENEGMEADTTNGTNGEINNIPLTQEEIENRLRSEHDLKDCSIQLFRFEYDIDDLQSDAGKFNF